MRRSTCSEIVVAAGASVLASAPAWAQCAMCNTSAAAGNVGRGLSISVLFMLAVLAGVVAWLVVAAAKSSRRDTTTGGAPPS
jgi:heme/copper-type cytochrome/quinol oxidase subunit 2